MKKFRFKESHSVRSIIQKISYNKLLSGGLSKVFLKKVWSNVIGENVSQYTENIYIKDNTLFLKIITIIDRVAIKENMPSEIHADGTWTYIILTESPWR